MSETVTTIWAIQHQYKTRPFEGWFTLADCNLKTEEQAKKALANCIKSEWMRDLNHRMVKITSVTEVVDGRNGITGSIRIGYPYRIVEETITREVVE